MIPWDSSKPGPWIQDLDGTDAVDLAGAPFFTPWEEGDYYQHEVLGSKTRCTQTLLEALDGLGDRPAVLVSGSSVGVYRYERSGEPVREETPPREDLWGQDSLAPEQLAEHAASYGVPVANLRTGVVLARDGGALAGQLPQFTRGFGGVVRPGSQCLPWIHIDDVVRIISTVLDDHNIRGPISATSPTPVRYREYAKTLARTVARPAIFPTPGWVLDRTLGRVATTITQCRRVLAAKALQHGQSFKYPDLDTALHSLARDRTDQATPPRSAA
jgi:uncharacterized protein